MAEHGAYTLTVRGRITADTAFFWFASADNREVLVKALDGRTFNGKFWLYFGSLTPQGYTIEVTDSVTDAVKTYTSPGACCGGGDIEAF